MQFQDCGVLGGNRSTTARQSSKRQPSGEGQKEPNRGRGRSGSSATHRGMHLTFNQAKEDLPRLGNGTAIVTGVCTVVLGPSA